MKTEDLINGCLNNPTFTLTLRLINVYDLNGENVNQTCTNDVPLYCVSNGYEWKLQNFNASEYDGTTAIYSNTFNINGIVFMFEPIKLQGYYRGDPDYLLSVLHVLRIPVEVESICMVYCMGLKETNSKYWWVGSVNKAD